MDIKKIANLVTNMGWRYISFRARHEVLKRSGLLVRKFPTAPPFKEHITLELWKKQEVKFLFQSKNDLKFPKNPTPELEVSYNQIRNGELLMFNSILTNLGKDYDWITNPDSGFKYDINKHWTQIPDFSKEAGDIKFVWEKSRFSYLYDIIRYDFHFDKDCAGLVFGDIISWINANPINQGPNYRCSQEMSLRVLNWVFALFYYRHSAVLTPDIFSKIQHVIYWHLHHIYNNINFSRIAVRNNHAITETLTLYLGGLFFPQMPGSAQWRKNGKKWFEQEIAYQIYEDGTFLQFSMNYQRIVVQLLTWGITLSEKNGNKFANVVYDGARSSVNFLRTCMIDENGYLPNYGANDGALFFKLSSTHYRDYRPQIAALSSLLGIESGFTKNYEDNSWYGIKNRGNHNSNPANGLYKFPLGGYYIIREPDTLTFIKCGGYKDRPSQADNLHVDIWYKGENLLLDAGSYKYNTDDKTMRYFSGTASHNTVMLDDKDQMQKGGHFIWYYWSQLVDAKLVQEGEYFVFTGEVKVFGYLNKDISHKRTIKHKVNSQVWEITDEISNLPNGMTLNQLWHTPEKPKNHIEFAAFDGNDNPLSGLIRQGWQSSLYGRKEPTREVVFSTAENKVVTIIKIGE